MGALSAEPRTHDNAVHGARAPRPVRRTIGLGPLLAVCGLAGGAGTTTLSYLVALAARHAWLEPVLVAYCGGTTGALAALADTSVPWTLPELAERLAAGASIDRQVYGVDRAGVHVLASDPEFSTAAGKEPLAGLLDHAREAHGLTVVDCGTLARPTEQATASLATHVAWVVPATSTGIGVASRVLDAAPRLAGKQLLVAREASHSHRGLRELRRIAAERRMPLIMIPDLAAEVADSVEQAAEASQVPVQAILGALTR